MAYGHGKINAIDYKCIPIIICLIVPIHNIQSTCTIIYDIDEQYVASEQVTPADVWFLILKIQTKKKQQK